MSLTIPRVGLSGRFTFKEPYQDLGTSDVTVVADQSFSYYDRIGQDVFTTIYKPRGLTEDVAASDRRNNVRIITFRHLGSRLIHIPSTYILKIPDAAEGYRWFQVVASLGILPDDHDMTRVEETIKRALLETMGIQTTAYVTSSELVDAISEADLEANELARRNAVENTSSPLKDIMLLERKLADAQGQIDYLMEILYSTP